jgi:autotransporter-associated beta strand protein
MMDGTGTFNLASGSTLRVTSDNSFTMRTRNIVLHGDASLEMLGSIWHVADDPATSASLLDLAAKTLSIRGSGSLLLGEATSGSNRIQGGGSLVVEGDAALSVEIAGQNTFSGGVRLRGGRLVVLNGSTGTLTIRRTEHLEQGRL